MTLDQESLSVLCAGRLYCDLVFAGLSSLPEMGSETFSESLTLHAGGGAFITAAAFNALGWSSSLLAGLPAAPFDIVVREDITQAGVDHTLCEAAPNGAGPQITVAMPVDGDRAFLSHKAGPAIPPCPQKSIWRHLHIGELRSLVEHPDLIAFARDSGMTISLDCGWDAELLAKGGNLAELIASVDVFLPNETEFQHLLMSGLKEHDAPLTVVKCGERGAKALGPSGWIEQPTKPVDSIDATGAGDAFNGGFLASWLAGDQLEECLIAGNVCGAASVQQPGGTGGLSLLRTELAQARAGAAQ